MVSFSHMLTIASFALAAVAAPRPEPAPEASTELVELVERAACSNAYNGNTANHLGPGQTYGCSKVSWVIFSYVCYVGSGPTYCCSGDLVSTSAGPMVGGCNLA